MSDDDAGRPGAAQPATCTAAEPFALRVEDDSMEPEFARGCVVIADPTGHARDGAFVLAEHQGEWLLRRLAIAGTRVCLEALNPRYPPLVSPEGLASVRAVVVQRAGARRRDHKHYR